MKISSWQLLLILFLSRLFTTITFFSLDSFSAAILLPFCISVFVEAVLFIPAIFLYKKYPDENLLISAFKIAKPFGAVLTAIYGVFLSFLVFKTLRFFLYFFSSAFGDLIPIVLVGVLLLIAAAFIAHLGIQAAARSASVVFAFFVAMLVIVLFATVPDFEAENYYTVPLSASSLWQGISDGVSRSDEVVVLVLIMPYLREKICKAVYGFSGAKLIVIEGIIICCMLLLGGYMSASPFSFFTMCKYANTAFIERLDAVYLFVWTCMGAIKLSLYSIALKPLYENVVTDKSKRLCLCCLPFIIGGIPALIFSCKNQMIIPFLDIHVTFYAILLLGFLLPLVVYFLRRCKREKN